MPTVTIDQAFQEQVSPIATVPPYACGAWTSNNTPGAYGSFSLYARLTRSVAGVAGAKARAVVHLRYQDVTLPQQPASDSGGYVTFFFALMGRQPPLLPATIDVTFTVDGTTVRCSQAFFTPR